ncbi:MAG: DUF11 domain-containing protein [Candidatus Marinimicrobia bacterium]|nr:DUF11 domain-containing protein [Candidatus Neomarinimicrobiota bacterium]
MRNKMLLIALLVLCLATSPAFAAGTPTGTVISNFATGNYRDANGNALPSVTSNTVTTTVSQVAGVDVSPSSNTVNVLGGESVTIALTVTNTGNGPDTFDLSKVTVESGGVNEVEIYHDANGNGVVDVGESIVTATSELAADAGYDLAVLVNNISGEDGSSETTTVTATSQFNSAVSDDATIVTTISTSVIEVTMTADNQNPKPGDIVTFTIDGANNGTALSKNVVVSIPIATNMTYVPGTITANGTSLTDAADGDSADYNITSSNTITVRWGDAVPGNTATGTFQAVVNDDVPVGTIITNTTTVTYENEAGTPQDPVTATSGGATLTVAHLYSVAVGADGSDSGDPGDDVFYATTVTNRGTVRM